MKKFIVDKQQIIELERFGYSTDKDVLNNIKNLL